MNWTKTAVLLLCLGGWASSRQPQPPHSSIQGPGNSMNVATAKVEQVFKLVDEGGYQFIAYQVTYLGHPVIVEDPISSTNVAVGGDLRFLVIRHDMTKAPNGGRKLLGFIVSKNQP